MSGATTITVTVPDDAFRILRPKATQENRLYSVVWTWHPGTCSLTTTTNCMSNGDCPGGETCNARKGKKNASVLVTK